MPDCEDIKYMRRCIDLAFRAEGLTCPNPMVGSVIINDGRIIGEGYHIRAGGPHAEVVAVNSVRDKILLRTSTLYVNLEPCSHFGRTPPCAPMIISHGIPRVVIGATDTSGKVSGRGTALLIESGCEVITGVLNNECRWLNRRFFTACEKQRPYIILKWAQSSDGFLDVLRSDYIDQRPAWITGKAEKILVHRWRATEQAILAGAGTVRADNPGLDVREWTGENPLRLILSKSGKLDNRSAVFSKSGTNVVFTCNKEARFPNSEKIILSEESSAARQIAGYLSASGVQSLLIEGGAEVLGHFISEGLWDEARIFTGRKAFGNGIKAPGIKGRLLSHVIFDLSTLEVFVRNNDSNCQEIDI